MGIIQIRQYKCLGNGKAENYRDMVADLVQSSKALSSDGSAESDFQSHLAHRTLSVVPHKKIGLRSQR
jgi:hypothetical protein